MKIEDLVDESKLWHTRGELGEDDTGIPNIRITMISRRPKFSQIVIHVSNLANKFSFNDCFLITIPDMKIVGERNKELITDQVLEDIFKWIDLNIEPIIAHGTGKIDSTFTYIEMLKKI